MTVMKTAAMIALCLAFGAVMTVATVMWFDLNLKGRADRMAADRDAWMQKSTEAERVRVLGPVAQRRLDARAGE